MLYDGKSERACELFQRLEARSSRYDAVIRNKAIGSIDPAKLLSPDRDYSDSRVINVQDDTSTHLCDHTRSHVYPPLISACSSLALLPVALETSSPAFQGIEIETRRSAEDDETFRTSAGRKKLR